MTPNDLAELLYTEHAFGRRRAKALLNKITGAASAAALDAALAAARELPDLAERLARLANDQPPVVEVKDDGALPTHLVGDPLPSEEEASEGHRTLSTDGYLVRLAPPCFVAEIWREDQGLPPPLEGVTASTNDGHTLCRVRWFGPPPHPDRLKQALLESCAWLERYNREMDERGGREPDEEGE